MWLFELWTPILIFGIQAIFATCEDALLSAEQSKVDAIVPFRDSPSLHDLGKLLWFIELEAPDYRLQKVCNHKLCDTEAHRRRCYPRRIAGSFVP